MTLQLFNSFKRKKEVFKPLIPNKVSIYVCGITPNSATHLGHAFTYTSFDVLIRFLKWKGYIVNYLQNATDINDSDDVVKQAENDGKTWQEEANYWIKHFHKQMDMLNVLRPNKYVLASTAIPKIQEIISGLLKKKLAYERNGSVYFDISSFKPYGKLSNFTDEQMLLISKERGNNPNDPNKKNPLDFVLWLGSCGEPMWESPWGKGRPGWHIECTSLIHKYLGERIDIHGGGRDLMYPHHESEIAQSEGFTSKKPFVQTWMHAGMVLYEGEKMSKSLGNLILVSDLLKKYSPSSLRWIILSHHYRAPWEYEEYELEEVSKKVKIIVSKLKGVRSDKSQMDYFEELMSDDLNTPKVLEFVEDLIGTGEKGKAKGILDILGFDIR